MLRWEIGYFCKPETAGSNFRYNCWSDRRKVKTKYFDLSEKAQKDIMSIDTEYTLFASTLEKILFKK